MFPQETIGARDAGSLTQEEAPGTGQGVSAAGDTDKDMVRRWKSLEVVQEVTTTNVQKSTN